MSGLEDLNFDFEQTVRVKRQSPSRQSSRSPIKQKLTSEKISELLPDVSIAKYNEPQETDGSIDDLLKREISEPIEHFEGRVILSKKIMKSPLGLNPVASVTVARMIFYKLRIGVSYTKEVEDAIEMITASLE
jgi:hypothetical protein